MYYEDPDDLSTIESARGCPGCKLYWEWLPGCPYVCAKLIRRQDEDDDD